MKIFITGGNGFIGSVVVRKLAERGHIARVLLRASSRTPRIDGLPYERVPGDVRDEASLREGMRGCEGVLHLASLSSWTDIRSPLMHEVGVGGTRNVLAAARAAGGLRTVFVSSSVAINGSRTPVVHDERSEMTLPLGRLGYAAAKVQAEALCREAASAGLPVCIVNPGEVYGPDDIDQVTAGNLVDFAKSSPVLICDGGTSVVHVEDVAEGVLAALEKGRPGERYILGGENLTIRQLAALTLSILGQNKRIVVLPNFLIRTLASVGSTLRLPLPFNPAVIPYATLYWFMDSTKAQKELGVRFRPARAVLEPTLEWLKKILLAPSGRQGES